jgi:hypothetical protein
LISHLEVRRYSTDWEQYREQNLDLRKEVIGIWRKLHIQKLHEVYPFLDIIYGANQGR